MWLCALLWWLPVGCQSNPPANPPPQPTTRLQPHLGTLVSITVYATPAQAQPAIDAAFNEIRAVDKLLSIHRDDSDLAKANRGEPVSPELQSVLQKALAIAKQTEGAFDPTIRPLAKLWGFIQKEQYRIPLPEELRPVLAKVDHRKVTLAGDQLRFATNGMSIDSGGFGKGYAVDRAIESLQQHGIRIAMVKAGGDMRVLGLPPGHDHLPVWIEDPRKRGNRTPVKLYSGALSTSGNYENFFEFEGIRYGHLLDPRTGQPVPSLGSCTAWARTCLESDAYATAAFILGPKRSQQLLPKSVSLKYIRYRKTGRVIE